MRPPAVCARPSASLRTGSCPRVGGSTGNACGSHGARRWARMGRRLAIMSATQPCLVGPQAYASGGSGLGEPSSHLLANSAAPRSRHSSQLGRWRLSCNRQWRRKERGRAVVCFFGDVTAWSLVVRPGWDKAARRRHSLAEQWLRVGLGHFRGLRFSRVIRLALCVSTDYEKCLGTPFHQVGSKSLMVLRVSGGTGSSAG